MTVRHVHIVDDEEAIRRSMQLMLRLAGYTSTAFESGEAFLGALPVLDEGCVLLDLRMPDIDGLEVQRRLAAVGANHSVFVMSGHGDLNVAVTALEQGALAFLEKPFSRATLEQALLPGFERLENPDGYRRRLQAVAGALQQLRANEQQILQLIARGHDTADMARLTGLTLDGVEMARSSILTKLHAGSVTELLQFAFAARRAAAL